MKYFGLRCIELHKLIWVRHVLLSISQCIVNERVADVAVVICQERKFLEQQQENTEAAMRRLAEQHRATVAQLEHESLQQKHQLLRGL